MVACTLHTSHLILPFKAKLDKVVKNSTRGQSCTREKARIGELEYSTYQVFPFANVVNLSQEIIWFSLKSH